MDAVVVATQEKAFKIAALLQLKKGQNKSMWTKLLTVEVVVVGMRYTLVAVDTGLDYLGRKKGRKQQTSLALLGFILLLFFFPCPKHNRKKQNISVISNRKIGKARRDTGENNNTFQGHIARNEMDTHVDTCCAGANWTLMHYTGEIFDVSPFLNIYAPAQEIPVARCCTVWIDDEDKEYLLVGDEMLCFGTAMESSLINPNHIRAYVLSINDDPFNENELGIDVEELLILFDTTGTLVHFESRVPTYEKQHICLLS